MTLVRKPQAIWWELIGARVAEERVVLTLSERCSRHRIEGHVDAVSMTAAFVVVGGWHVPLEDVLAVHRPHFTQQDAA